VLTRSLLTTERRELLLLVLSVTRQRQLLRPVRPLLLRVLAGLVLRLVRLVLGHEQYFAAWT
jgi:hypothetical protein